MVVGRPILRFYPYRNKEFADILLGTVDNKFNTRDKDDNTVLALNKLKCTVDDCGSKFSVTQRPYGQIECSQ
mgnify:CR=1 FL=1